MSEATVIPPRAGEIAGDAPDRRVEILADHDGLNATWSRFGPRRDGADLHVHRAHTDLFYVLEGELTIRLGPDGDGVALPAGTLVEVPPLVVHGFRNGSDDEVRYLNLHAPGRGFADYLRAMRDRRTLTYDQWDPPADGGRPAGEVAIGARHAAGAVAGVRSVLLSDAADVAIAEHVVEPGTEPAPRHVHRRHVQSLYVLEGALVVMAGARALHAHEGAWVHVPAGVPHAMAVAGTSPVRVLDLHTPNCGFGGFLRARLDGSDEQELAAARAAFDESPAA